MNVCVHCQVFLNLLLTDVSQGVVLKICISNCISFLCNKLKFLQSLLRGHSGVGRTIDVLVEQQGWPLSQHFMIKFIYFIFNFFLFHFFHCNFTLFFSFRLYCFMAGFMLCCKEARFSLIIGI